MDKAIHGFSVALLMPQVALGMAATSLRSGEADGDDVATLLDGLAALLGGIGNRLDELA